jgi:hypothetical protein
MKSCWHNAQRFLLEAPAELGVQYREGWVQSLIPVAHAWLVYEGRLLDLTLQVDEECYLRSYAVSRDAVRRHVWGSFEYSAVRPERLERLNPLAEVWQRYAEMVEQGVLGEA